MEDTMENLEPETAAPASSDPIQLRAITVQTGRLVCDVAIPDERYRGTSPRLAAFAQASYPDLAQHACVNDEGSTFGDVMEHTSTAHLLEHIVISLQTRTAPEGSRPFVGTTEWVDEQAGEARVQVSFLDDLQALRAFNEATRFLNIAVVTCLP